jgi:hypothetical protein
MNKQLLIQMLELTYVNQRTKHIYDLYLQISVDPELDDVVNITDFSNEFYSVRSIAWIKQCLNFRLI